jgi:glutathione S-transferase
MHKLYYYKLCPFSRSVAILLAESGVQYSAIQESFWEKREHFIQINPMGTVPVLITPEGDILNHSSLIYDYIERKFPNLHLFPKEKHDFLEMKKIIIWFNEKFFNECGSHLLCEKIIYFLKSKSQPDPNVLSGARYNLSIHLEYIQFLLENSSFLMSDKFTFADAVVASHLSVLDYLREIKWSTIPMIKDWYCVIKSRPSFRPFLRDSVSGFPPPKHYSMLDF